MAGGVGSLVPLSELSPAHSGCISFEQLELPGGVDGLGLDVRTLGYFAGLADIAHIKVYGDPQKQGNPEADATVLTPRQPLGRATTTQDRHASATITLNTPEVARRIEADPLFEEPNDPRARALYLDLALKAGLKDAAADNLLNATNATIGALMYIGGALVVGSQDLPPKIAAPLMVGGALAMNLFFWLARPESQRGGPTRMSAVAYCPLDRVELAGHVLHFSSLIKPLA